MRHFVTRYVSYVANTGIHTLFTRLVKAPQLLKLFVKKKIYVRVFLYRLHLAGQLSVYEFTALSVEELKK